ncbi:hypothetical protein AMELA_G00193780 [Ameiurus melas]|uniref:Tetraspanin n=1 Tax=Ameiurus melas TaxID=219545 RepID=A0A7J6A5D0_AMEME|nr:hypothetical protein AMELA_G00193780 [Ameiurus melas]
MGVVADRTVTKIPAIQELANTTSPIVIIVVGAVIFLITSIGCCGVWKDNYCMVTTFVVLLLIIIIIETVILAISVYVWKGKLEDLPEKMMQDYTSNPDIQKGLDDIQEELKCCGAVNASDWVFFKSDKISVPDSCCKNVSPNCGAGALKNANKIYIVILGIVFSCTLMAGICRGYEVM